MSVSSLPQASVSSPTLFISSRRARLLTFSATLRSPQTCFRLPHCLGCFAACGPPTLCASRLAAAAAHRAAIVDCGNIDEGICCAERNQSQYRHLNYLIPIVVIGIYGDISQYNICCCYAPYGAIGDFETFYYSRLTAKFCVGGMRMSVQGLRCPQSLRPGPSVLRVGRQESGQLRPLHRQAGTDALLVLFGSSTSAEPPQKSPTIRKRGMRDRVGKSRLSLAFVYPPTPGR